MVNGPIRYLNSMLMRFGVLILLSCSALMADTTEFCLEGEFNLGFRMQHHRFGDAWEPTTWCVITDDDTMRVKYSMTGKSNSDMQGDWSVAYFPPNTVRIVNQSNPPDVEFQGTDNADEAIRVRRIDPRRLMEMEASGPAQDIRIATESGKLKMVATEAVLPIQGKLVLTWSWQWEDSENPRLMVTAGPKLTPLFRATGRWRTLSEEEAAYVWQVTPGAPKIEVPGDRWPSKASTRLINLTDDVFLVRGIRTGFQHLVVDTQDGLVVADAPANWLEFHQIPPANLMPDLPIDGLSSNLIEYLRAQFPGRKVHAVALTHFHDDHAGGAPAFATAGARVYAPAHTAKQLSNAFAQRTPGMASASFPIAGVKESVTLGTAGNQVTLVPFGDNPHVFEMLGVWAVDRDYFFVSDIHVPRDETDGPAETRAKTECWFANWAVTHLPAEVRVINSHSPVVTPVSRLAKYLESEACS